MEIRPIYRKNKQELLPLLLLGDEQESMIDQYFEKSAMFGLYQGTLLCGIIAITFERENLYEIKNMAVLPEFQRQGYGRMLIEYVFQQYGKPGMVFQVGTGEVPSTVGFYQACGFQISHKIKDFFLQYDHPIYEDGIQLRDMIYLKKVL